MITSNRTQSPLADAVLYLARNYVQIFAFTGGNAPARNAVTTAFADAHPEYRVVAGFSSGATSDIISALANLESVIVSELEDLEALITITGLGGVVFCVVTDEEDQGTAEADGFQYWDYDQYIDFDSTGVDGAVAQVEQHIRPLAGTSRVGV